MNINIHVIIDHQSTNPSIQRQFNATVSLLEILWQQYNRVSAYRSASTMSNYATAIRALGKYLKRDIPASELSDTLLGGFERWLRGRNVCLNTISCYMRSLRSLLAVIDGDTKKLFAKVYTGSAKTEKRSIPPESISRINALQLLGNSFIELARDVFMFSFYAMGMPFVDVAHLRKQQIASGQIVYYRHKTGQRVQIAIEQPMLDIIRRHSDKAQADYVFPLLQEGTAHEYKVMLGRYNRALHRLARLASVRHNLTSYVVRHTWASTAYSANVDLPVISKALGHANTQTTLTYIREIDDHRVAAANHNIIGLVAQTDAERELES